MPIEIQASNPVVCIRRAAFERGRFQRAEFDARYGLADNEFRIEGDLIVVGPLFGDTATRLLADLEAAGLEYFDDYFELSGNWPSWLRLFATHTRDASA